MVYYIMVFYHLYNFNNYGNNYFIHNKLKFTLKVSNNKYYFLIHIQLNKLGSLNCHYKLDIPKNILNIFHYYCNTQFYIHLYLNFLLILVIHINHFHHITNNYLNRYKLLFCNYIPHNTLNHQSHLYIAFKHLMSMLM